MIRICFCMKESSPLERRRIAAADQCFAHDAWHRVLISLVLLVSASSRISNLTLGPRDCLVRTIKVDMKVSRLCLCKAENRNWGLIGVSHGRSSLTSRPLHTGLVGRFWVCGNCCHGFHNLTGLIFSVLGRLGRQWQNNRILAFFLHS